jgi:ribosome-associated translation inhibitor RaiA|tara:strand:- start:2530 stop:2754 length:225 start_codon:yes stop_codon:yes gene_type:complete
MIHPHHEDLTEFTTPQIEAKLTELSKKYFMTRNPEVQMQMSMILDGYRDELRTRYRKEMVENGDKDLDNLINIS